MAQFERHFTLEEARAELPALRERLAAMRSLMASLKQAQVEMQRIVTLVSSNGKGSGHPEFGETISALQGIVKWITDRGIEIKDLDRGLVDFPHMRDGEEVFLCWLDGEDTIFYWHTIEDGFSGRTPL